MRLFMPDDQLFPYVWVNPDGSAREVHPNERILLETPFQGGDGGRPYIKSRYSQKNGWGELEGFLKRSKLPRGTEIHPAPRGGSIEAFHQGGPDPVSAR